MSSLFILPPALLCLYEDELFPALIDRGGKAESLASPPASALPGLRTQGLGQGGLCWLGGYLDLGVRALEEK